MRWEHWHAHGLMEVSHGIEPVVVALIGVRSAILGVLASGVVQATLAQLDRKRDARNAARLLCMKLHSADMALKALEDHGAWVPPALDFGRYMTAWEQRAD